MKVIVAGYPKTGTKTMATALRILGYNVHDFIEQYWFHCEEWMKIFKTGGAVHGIKLMYEGVDAVTDAPACYFWEQLSEAFPDSKIVLLTRDEDNWFESWKRQYDQLDIDIYRNYFIGCFSPSGWKLRQFGFTTGLGLFGMPIECDNSKIGMNELMMRMRYRLHNNYVLTKAPKDKLLVYNVKDGWETLCRFLGKDIPDQPFPHRNSGCGWFKEFAHDNAIIQRMHKEATITASLLLCVTLFGAYKIFRALR